MKPDDRQRRPPKRLSPKAANGRPSVRAVGGRLGLGAYLEQIGRTPLLTRREELRLARTLRCARRRLLSILASTTPRFVLHEIERLPKLTPRVTKLRTERIRQIERELETIDAAECRNGRRGTGAGRDGRLTRLRMRTVRRFHALELRPEEVERLAGSAVGLQRRLAGAEGALARVARRRESTRDHGVRRELDGERRRLAGTIAEIEQRAALGRDRIFELVSRIEYRLLELRTARVDLVRANLRLVVSVARAYAVQGVAMADLIQEGNLGLLKAADEFDPERGFRFSTYATWWIRRAVVRALADIRTVRLPLDVLEAVGRVVRTRTFMTQRLGRTPTEDELSAHLKLPPAKIRELLALTRVPLSLDAPPDEAGERLEERIEDPASDSAEASLLRLDARRQLGHALRRLSPREARILALRFGLGAEGERTLAEVARRLRLTPKRIGQIQSEALGKLRRAARLGRIRGGD